MSLHEASVGEFLLRRLREVAIPRLFGVAGDFNLEFLEQLEHTEGMEWVGCCNELNASYAADGYARHAGASAVVTTYGVGELSALCGIAGSFAEHLSVVFIVGAPPLSEIDAKAVLHHTAGDGNYDDMMACARQFTVGQARITPENAVSEIDRLLTACIRERRPVYLQLPSDICASRIETPTGSLEVCFSSDEEILQEFSNEASRRINAATSVAILVDADVARYGQQEKISALATRLGCPIAVMGTAQGVIDHRNPAYVGIYAGAFSKPYVRECVESAECLLLVTVRFADSTTGSFSESIPSDRSIAIDTWHAAIEGNQFRGIFLGDVIDRLLKDTVEKPSFGAVPDENSPAVVQPLELTQEWLWHRTESFLQRGDVVVVENGTPLSGVSGLRLPSNVLIITQALWGSIGYSLPATFGSMMANPQRRHVLFIGDGSFQLTAQELSSMLRHLLCPIIFLLNNDGYTIERLILGENSSYNNIQPWKYRSLCDVFADQSLFDTFRVTTPSELEAALKAACVGCKLHFIELVLPRMDAPPTLRALGPVYAKQDYGLSWSRSGTDVGRTNVNAK